MLAGVVRGCDEDGLLGEDPHGIVTSSSTELGFDWQRSGSGVRVACRGAQLVWNIGSDRWEAIFSGVRVPSEGASATFDELLLAIYSPLGVHVFRHDLQTGVRVKGRDAIQLVAPRGETRWREALLAIQSKLSKAGCRRLLELPYDDPRVAAAVAATPRPLTSAAFAYRPLAECTSAQRAKLLTSLCRRIDGQWLHPGTQLEDPPSAVVAGGRRQPKPAFEWQRGEIRDPDETSPAAPVRVACKSAQLLWDLTSKYWKVQFTNVKLPLGDDRDSAFDELLLAVYTPEGVHIFRHDLRAGVSTNGKANAAGGYKIRFYGLRQQMDWRISLEAILSKMEGAGCMRLAVVEFDSMSEAT